MLMDSIIFFLMAVLAVFPLSRPQAMGSICDTKGDSTRQLTVKTLNTLNSSSLTSTVNYLISFKRTRSQSYTLMYSTFDIKTKSDIYSLWCKIIWVWEIAQGNHSYQINAYERFIGKLMPLLFLCKSVNP